MADRFILFSWNIQLAFLKKGVGVLYFLSHYFLHTGGGCSIKGAIMLARCQTSTRVSENKKGENGAGVLFFVKLANF